MSQSRKKTKESQIGSWRLADGEQSQGWRNQKLASEADLPRTEPKKIAISHYHQIRKDWIILPYGMYYNSELLKARIGDIILFSDKIEREIEYITPIKTHAGLTDFLCRKTYGVGLKRIKERWKMNVECVGHKWEVIEQDKVLLIYLKEQKHEQYTK